MQKLQSQDDSISILKKYGIETPEQIVARDAKELLSFASRNKFPLFLKVDSPEISHKTDLGLVTKASNLKEAVLEFRRILEKAKTITKNINGIVVQEYVEGMEFIIGIKNDPVFGKVIMFGTGGIYAEIFKDVSFRLCPIDEKEALKMIKETRAFDIMHARGKNIDERKIARVLESVSQLAVKEKIEGLDINPFIAGERLVAVDVKIIK